VEFFRTLATTQYLNHVRPGNLVTVDLRDGDGLELIGRAFDRASHTAEVRHVDVRRGRHNIPNVGLFLWRLQGYRVSRADARAVAAATAAEQGRYTFSPLGIDGPLFNLARTEAGITHLALETDVPGPIRPRALHDEIVARRAGGIDEERGRDLYLGEPPVVEVFLDGADDPLGPDEITVCDLSDPPVPVPEGWRRPPSSVRVGIDPRLGRLALPAGQPEVPVRVSYVYGFSGDLGGGPYDRRASVLEALPRSAIPDRHRGVRKGAPPGDPDLFASLAEAIDEWNAGPVPLGVISVMDSASYDDPVPEIEIPEGTRLVLVAADWLEEQTDLGPVRRPGRLTPSGVRPHIRADLAVRGTAPAGSPEPGSLVLDGLLVEGSLTVAQGNLGGLRLAHCTLAPVPGAASVLVLGDPAAGMDNGGLRVDLDRTISGPVSAADTVRRLCLTDAVVDGGVPGGGFGPAVTGPDTCIESVTVLGSTEVRSLYASNAVFLRPVDVKRRQVGCVRYSFVPPGSVAPRRFRCRPAGPEEEGRIVPRFVSTRYGDSGFAQLSAGCPTEIAAGADGEGEMGAFRFLQQPHRLANLRASVDEYLRLGLEAGVFLVT
jgi:hypothetical protein